MVDPPYTAEQRRQLLEAMGLVAHFGFISIDVKRYLALKAWLDLTGGWPDAGWYAACAGQPELPEAPEVGA
jgi:hypothetical protein